MSDLFLGQTCSDAWTLTSGGAAYTLALNWQADMVIFDNITQWTNTAGNIPRNFWFRTLTDAAESYQQQVIDSNAAQSFNFLNPTTNGFTVADTSGGVASSFASISAISQADPCVVTTSSAHGFQTDQIVRITDLGGDIPTPRGMNQLNNNRYRIVVASTTTFSLKDPITDDPIDSAAYTAYVSGGYATLETHVLTLNNPQVSPYSSSNPYNPNAFAYDPITYQLTAGTEVMGSDGDVFFVHAYKFGSFTALGDIG